MNCIFQLELCLVFLWGRSCEIFSSRMLSPNQLNLELWIYVQEHVKHQTKKPQKCMYKLGPDFMRTEIQEIISHALLFLKKHTSRLIVIYIYVLLFFLIFQSRICNVRHHLQARQKKCDG